MMDNSRVERILRHLVQESSSQMGFLRIADIDGNTVDHDHSIGISRGILRGENHAELWGYLQHDPLFEEVIKNESVYVFEIKGMSPLEHLYEEGIRYGLIIPFYHQNLHMGSVFLGGVFAYPHDTVVLIHKKIQTLTEFFVKTTEDNSDNEPLKVRLKRYEQSAKALFEYNPDVMWWIDTNGTILSSNTRVEEITGFHRNHFSNQSFDQFFQSQDLDTAIGCFVMAKKGKPQNFEAAFIHKEGMPVDLNITFVPVTVEHKIVGVYGIGKDITERKKYIEALKESNDFTAAILESITDGFLSVDKDWCITYWNREAERITGTKREDCLGGVLWSVLPEMIETISFTKLHKALYEQVTVQYEYYTSSTDKWYLVHAYPSRNGLSVFIQDVTGRKKAEQQVAYMTYYDTLTGLPNQKLFMERLSHTLLRDNNGRESLAILVVNLDRFNNVNEMLGFTQGDRVLVAVSKRLNSCLREEDTLCRCEGDVFTALLRKISRVQVEKVAEHISSEFQKPFLFDHQELLITPSIGVSFYPDDGGDSEALMAHANTAMRSSKEKGGNNVQFYNEAMNTLLSVNMTKDLSNALKRNELTVVYQPQVDIRTGRITGNEVLLRWNHPEYGKVSPGEFIPLAEESGLIVPIGEWVLRTACAQNKEWQDAGLEPMTVSVNLSPRQFASSNIVEFVKEVLEETGLPPHYLDLEITEGMTMDVNRVITTLWELKNIGVRISMDDFGKGYSSLFYLKRFPLDTLKIDQSFVCDCMTDENDAILVKTIISMAHHLKLNVIAEGVETREQLVFLQQNLCDEVQGYLFSEPLCACELVQKLTSIKGIVKKYGMNNELSEKMWLEEQVRVARQELEDTIRKQQGVTFKFREQNGRFIHTLCDGELLQRLQFTPEQVVGKALHDYLPSDGADELEGYYRKAWYGKQDVTFEFCLNGIWFLASLRPIFRGGRVVEVIGTCVDITTRKQVEEELRATKEQLESFIQNTSDAIDIKTPDKVIVRVNEAFVNMFGWMEEEVVGKPLPIILEHLMEEADSLFQRVLNGEVIADYETVRQRKDGSLVDVSLTLSPIKDISGKIICIAANYRDISERKRAEKAIRESEERYRLLIEMSPDIILVHNHGEVLFMNQAGLDFAGIRNVKTEFGNRSLYSVLIPEQREESMERMHRLLSGEKVPPIERKVIRKNGQIFHFEVTSAPVEFKGREVIQVIARDVTERKRSEEALKLVHEQYRVIAENMTDLIAVFDTNWNLKYASPSYQVVLGYPLSYLNKKSAFDLIHPDDIAIVTNTLAEISLEKFPRQIEFRYRHMMGDWVYVEAKGTPILSGSGEIDQLIIVSRDITDRKVAEDKYRKSEALAAVGELAAGVAHEIRNPITSIKGFVQLMKKGSQFKPEYFEIMFSEFKTLEAKIDEFLLLAKPRTAQYTSNNLWELLQDVFMLLESQAILHNVQIFSEPASEQLMIMCERNQLKQVFVNLIKNSIESMPNGGEILVSMKKKGSEAYVTIVDQGCGINEERLKRIGEPFYSSKEKGTGLGLTISHKIVKEHGGAIVFQSEVNKGTTVHVSFPIFQQ